MGARAVRFEAFVVPVVVVAMITPAVPAAMFWFVWKQRFWAINSVITVE